MDYRNDRNHSLGQDENEHNSDPTKSNYSRTNSNSAWSNPTEKQRGYGYYGRDNASMRGNDYYGGQGFGKDYNKRASITPDFRQNQQRAGSMKYDTTERAYGEGAPYGHSSYGQEPIRDYNTFINHNYGRTSTENDPYLKPYNKSLGDTMEVGYGSTSYNHRDLDRERSVLKNAKAVKGSSKLTQRYSENDGRRR